MGLPFVVVGHGKDDVPLLLGRDAEGLVGLDATGGYEGVRLYSFEPEDVASAVSVDPAAARFGIELVWSEREERRAAEVPAAVRKSPGYLFGPIESSDPFGTPVVTGFGEVRSQLLKHRAEVPSVETVRLSTVFAGSTIRTGIETAERAFACIVELFVARGRKFPSIGEIDGCIRRLGLYESRRRMYEESAAWAPAVVDAIAKGARDRALRKELYLGTELPTGISLAKLSFILALLGQDTVCLDARILDRMFGAGWEKRSKGWAAKSELALKRYEQTEDAFLRGNPFYRPGDPIGRARAQWQSWESVGGAPATHSVWLRVIQ
jgi:hypothetical protein